MVDSPFSLFFILYLATWLAQEIYWFLEHRQAQRPKGNLSRENQLLVIGTSKLVGWRKYSINSVFSEKSLKEGRMKVLSFLE